MMLLPEPGNAERCPCCRHETLDHGYDGVCSACESHQLPGACSFAALFPHVAGLSFVDLEPQPAS